MTKKQMLALYDEHLQTIQCAIENLQETRDTFVAFGRTGWRLSASEMSDKYQELADFVGRLTHAELV